MNENRDQLAGMARSTPSRRLPRLTIGTKLLLASIAVITSIILIVNLLLYRAEPKDPLGPATSGDSERALDRTFDGDSGQLLSTDIVPALGSPLDGDKSAVWCGTMGLAWQQIQNDITKVPIVLKAAEATSELLNREPRAELDPAHYYVAAGWYHEGIIERIHGELASRFPEAPLPTMPKLPLDGKIRGLAYAYLNFAFNYQFTFKESDAPLSFRDAAGRTTEVKSFGIRGKDEGQAPFRSQVLVLFRDGAEFAVDLSRGSTPYQLILARIPRQATLAATVADLDRRIAAGKPTELSDQAVLLVPTMHWRVQHRFRELEQKEFAMPNWEKSSLEEVEQIIDYRMDRKGVVLTSVMKVRFVAPNGDDHGGDPNYCVFDRPFLVVLKKRDGRPFFVLWVANAELLFPY